MRFNFCLANLYFPEISRHELMMVSMLIGDGIRFMQKAFEELGHEVTINRSFADKDAINIFWERFYTINGVDDGPAMLKKNGIRYGLICTELLTAGGFYNPQNLSEEKSREAYAEYKYQGERADFIWHLMEETGDACRAINSNSHFFPFGHVSSYAEIDGSKSRRYLADYSFTGNLTERRVQIVSELLRRGVTISAIDTEPDYLRLSVLESCRASLNIQKTEKHAIFSMTRIPHAIINRIPLVVEYDGTPSYLSKYCLTAPPANFIDTCVDFVRRPDLRDYVQEIYDRHAREMPMRPLMERLIRETFGV